MSNKPIVSVAFAICKKVPVNFKRYNVSDLFCFFILLRQRYVQHYVASNSSTVLHIKIRFSKTK